MKLQMEVYNTEILYILSYREGSDSEIIDNSI